MQTNAEINDKWRGLARELSALFWAVVGLLVAVFGLGLVLYGMAIIWPDTPRSTQYMIAGLAMLYMSQHPSLKKRSKEG